MTTPDCLSLPSTINHADLATLRAQWSVRLELLDAVLGRLDVALSEARERLEAARSEQFSVLEAYALRPMEIDAVSAVKAYQARYREYLAVRDQHDEAEKQRKQCRDTIAGIDVAAAKVRS